MHAVAGLANKVAMAAPFLLVTSLGLQGRRMDQNFQFAAYSKSDNDRLSSFIPIVTKTEALFDGKSLPTNAALRATAHMWCAQSRAGRLQMVPQVAMDDTSREGPKGEIVRDATNLAEALTKLSSLEFQEKQYEASAKDTFLAASVMQVPKSFDFASLSICSLMQRRCLNQLSLVWSTLRPGTRHVLGMEVRRFETKPALLRQLTLNSKLFAVQQEASVNQNPSELSKVEDYLNLQPLASKMASKRERKNFALLSIDDQNLENLVDEFRLGCSTSLDTNKKIEQLAAHVLS